MRVVLLSAAAAFALACSGGKLADLGDAAATDGAVAPGDASGDDATPPATDAAPPPPPPVEAGPNCAALELELQSMQAQAETCCPICNTAQCNVAVKGVCCPFSVTGTAPAGYEALLAQFKAECPVSCPAIPCRVAPSNVCTPVNPGNPSGKGVCQ
jgi:hypothetical protein